MNHCKRALTIAALVVLYSLAGSYGAAHADSPSVEDQNPVEIVVTGSRIERAANDQPAPVAVVDAAAIAQSGFTNLSDILTRAPQVGVGAGPTDAQSNDYGPDAGATFINLRSLGTNRTLVLVDGFRRVSGTASSSAVDLATIPANMIDRIEITTGGAAAVYGADAVTGVVNVILKHHADGLELSAQEGISGHGDDFKSALSALYGQSIGDRGEFTLGLSYNHEPRLATNQRSFGRLQIGDFSNPDITATTPYTVIEYPGVRFPNTSYGGAFVINGVRYTIGANGALRPTQNGATPYGPLGFLGVGGGDGFNYDDFSSLRNESTVLSTLAHVAYDLGSGIRFTADLQFSNSKSDVSLQPLFQYGNIIDRANPFIPASVGALMDQYGLTQLSVGRTDVDQGLNARVSNRDTYTVVTGLDGDLGTQFKWKAFYQYGEYDNSSTFVNEQVQSRYLQALDVTEGPSGPVCADPTAVAAGCKPLNIFGPNAASPAALAYIHYNPVTGVVNTQQVFGAQLTGKLLNLPAGPLAIAAGIEDRKESQQIQQDGLGHEGLLFFEYGPSSEASFSVKEAFVEMLAPVVKNQRFAQELEVEAAGRVSDYDSVGRTFAWKLGAQWAPTDDLRFRVTRSSSVRAPNLTELYSPGTTSFAGFYDPCAYNYINSGTATRAANCAALGVPANYHDPLAAEFRLLNTVGNADLRAETSKSWTAGVVLTPRPLPGLTVSIDWWSIDISGAINTLPTQQVINGCVDAATISNPLCPFVTRGPSAYGGTTNDPHAITLVTLAPVNIGILKAEGVDFQATYGFDLRSHLLQTENRLKIMLGGTYYMKNDSIVNANDPQNVIYTAGDSILPKLRANVTPEFDAGPLAFAWSVRYISSSKVDVTYAPLFSNDNNVSSRIYSDLFASYLVNKTLKVSAGINNLFDVAPPSNGSTYEGTGSGSLFDNIGRYFFAQVTAKF